MRDAVSEHAVDAVNQRASQHCQAPDEPRLNHIAGGACLGQQSGVMVGERPP